MKSDFHMHTSFSSDSATAPVEMIEQSINLGLTDICITDHQDWDFPKEKYNLEFTFDTDKYFNDLNALKEQYKDKINIHIGVELGLQTQVSNDYVEYLNKYPFDFVIGSIHLVNRIDPYYDEYFEGRDKRAAFIEYFEAALDNYSSFKDFDSVGHLDYIFRYGPNVEEFVFNYKDYGDILDELLRLTIKNDKALEVNTAGFKAGLNHPNPHEDILKRYKELGGELITIGSDGHVPHHIGYAFDKVDDILNDCGFNQYTIFENRKPVFKPI